MIRRANTGSGIRGFGCVLHVFMKAARSSVRSCEKGSGQGVIVLSFVAIDAQLDSRGTKSSGVHHQYINAASTH
jgi:hypothetical protein